MKPYPWATLSPVALEHVLITATISREMGGVWLTLGDWDGGEHRLPSSTTLLAEWLAMERN